MNQYSIEFKKETITEIESKINGWTIQDSLVFKKEAITFRKFEKTQHRLAECMIQASFVFKKEAITNNAIRSKIIVAGSERWRQKVILNKEYQCIWINVNWSFYCLSIFHKQKKSVFIKS